MANVNASFLIPSVLPEVELAPLGGKVETDEPNAPSPEAKAVVAPKPVFVRLAQPLKELYVVQFRRKDSTQAEQHFGASKEGESAAGAKAQSKAEKKAAAKAKADAKKAESKKSNERKAFEALWQMHSVELVKKAAIEAKLGFERVPTIEARILVVALNGKGADGLALKEEKPKGKK